MVLRICRHVHIWIFGIMARLQIHRLWVIILVQLPLGFVTVHCYSQFISMDAKRRKTGAELDKIMHAELDKMIKEDISVETPRVAKPGPNTVAPAIGEKVLCQSTFGGEAEEFRVAYVPEEAAETLDSEKELAKFKEKEQTEEDERVARFAKALSSFQEAEKQELSKRRLSNKRERDRRRPEKISMSKRVRDAGNPA